MQAHAVVLVLAAGLYSSFAPAQSYPERPVRVIVPVPAGGSPDVAARTITPGLSKLLKQQFVVDNRPGAGSLIGTDLAVKAPADGYTLLLSSGGPLTILPHLQKQIPYHPLQDLAPISLISAGPFVLITHPSSPFKSIKELAALAKSAPGKFNYASAGNGSPNHLATELFKSLSGIDITHVPYKGAPQGVTDVIANQISLNFSSIPPVLGHLKAGRLRALVTSAAKRSPQLPEVPTAAETVAPGFEFTSWFGLLAPARTPRHIVAVLHDAVVKVLNSPETRTQFETRGAEVIASTPAEFSAHLRREFDSNGKAARAADIRID
jgi:tripartite-type tricarboxylate transporter receptor subunit TctC